MGDRPDARSDRERVRDRLKALKDERDALDQRRKRLTEERHRLLREAHDLGWSWSEIAAFAGYENATVARNQASGRGSRPDPAHPPGTHSVREAAKQLGVTPQTIYNWIGAGRLEVADDSSRGTRVVLPPASPPSAGESE